MLPNNDEVFEDVEPNIVVGPDLVIGTDHAAGKDQTIYTVIDQSGHVITVSSEEILNAISQSPQKR